MLRGCPRWPRGGCAAASIGVAIEFGKAAVLSLAGVPGPGGMTLTGFVPMRWLKAL
jgi:hypothetical protein